MDEFTSGMEPEVKRYFRKIIKSFSVASIWLLSTATAGFFFRLALIRDGIRWYNVVFYLLFLLSLIFLIFYLYNLWRKKQG